MERLHHAPCAAALLSLILVAGTARLASADTTGPHTPGCEQCAPIPAGEAPPRTGTGFNHPVTSTPPRQVSPALPQPQPAPSTSPAPAAVPPPPSPEPRPKHHQRQRRDHGIRVGSPVTRTTPAFSVSDRASPVRLTATVAPPLPDEHATGPSLALLAVAIAALGSFAVLVLRLRPQWFTDEEPPPASR